jgi:LPS sulfotransferase NodH
MGPRAAVRRARASATITGLACSQQASAPPQSPTISYIICTNPRSGSWLLSEGLATTNLAGNPREWFNVLEEQEQKRLLGGGMRIETDYAAYLHHVITSATTPNGICGIKLHYYQFVDMAQKLTKIEAFQGLSTARAIAAAFADPKYVWLTRRDKARQAISYYRACQSQEWWQIDGISRPPGSTSPIEFDSRAIRQLEDTLVSNDDAWRQYFRTNNIDVLVVDYEDLAIDYAGNVSRILQWLGIQGPKHIAIPPPRLKRQSDAKTERWLARYLSCRLDGEQAQADGDHAVILSERDDRRSSGTDLSCSSAPEAPLHSPLFQWSNQPRNRPQHRTLLSPTKPERLLNALARLTQLDPRTLAIERRTNLSRQEFLERYYVANRPVVIQGLLDAWPARQLWTASYLKDRVGDSRVEIMAGRDADPHYELNIDRHRKLVRFADYVDAVENGSVTNDHYLVANNNFFERPGCDVLLQDIVVFPDYLNPMLMRGRSFLWFGPAGTVTPLHHDACNILMALIRGKKHFKIIPAAQWSLVYNSNSFFSELDCEVPNYDRWPMFKEATVIELTLEAGEVLFMPVGWWHHVRTHEVSIMVSFTNFLFPNSYDW